MRLFRSKGGGGNVLGLLLAFYCFDDTAVHIIEAAATDDDAGIAAPTTTGRCETSFQLYECPVVANAVTTTTTTTTVTDCLTGCPGFPSTLRLSCVNRQLFDPDFWWRDGWTIILWCITAGIAMAAGVGGGGIFVPAGILLTHMAPRQSAGLSQASVFGATLGGLVLNWTARHPMSGRIVDTTSSSSTTFYNRPLIDYDMALFLSPMLMAGAVLGVLIQSLLPNWLYLLLAVIVLSYTADTTYKKYLSTYAKEVKAQQQEKRQEQQTSNGGGPPPAAAIGHDNNGSTTNTTSPLVAVHGSAVTPYGATTTTTTTTTTVEQDRESGTAVVVNDAAQEQRRAYYLRQDARQFPAEKLLALIVLWCGLLVLTILLGGQGVDSPLGITCQSRWYLVLMAAQFIWMFIFAVVYGIKLLSDQTARRAVDYPYLPDDVVWDIAALRFFGIATLLGGVVAGLIGIGGGMVLGPLMLVRNVPPTVASATTATMMVLTSSSVAIIFCTSGLVPWTYAVVLSGTCFVGSLVGKSTIDNYVKKTGRPSLLIWILAVIIGVATAGCAIILVRQLHDSHWCLDGFNDFCPATSTLTTTTTAAAALVGL